LIKLFLHLFRLISLNQNISVPTRYDFIFYVFHVYRFSKPQARLIEEAGSSMITFVEIWGAAARVEYKAGTRRLEGAI
jgi:hypothetical protein